MPGCASCKTTTGLQVCLFCGRSYCSNHRAESGGLPACMGCLAEERARAERVSAAAAALPARRGASARGAATGSPTASDRVGSIGTDVLEVDGSRPAAPPPLPEPDPPQAGPLILSVIAGAPTAVYLHWLFTKLAADDALPSWTPVAGTALGTAFVAGAVWVIARSRLSR